MPLEPRYEKRYPYIDRDFLEFMYAIPREQLVRPGQRRSLMRRALIGIVPDELLNRKRKAYVARAPMAAISAEWARLVEISQQMVSSSLEIVETKRFWEALQKARHGREVPIVALMRTWTFEAWLTNFDHSRLTQGEDQARAQSHNSMKEILFLSPRRPFSQLRVP